MSMRRTSHLRMHVNPISSHADYSDATQMQRVWDFACFPVRKGAWITADRDQESQIFVQLKPIPSTSTGITSAKQSKFCTIAVSIQQNSEKKQIVKIEHYLLFYPVAQRHGKKSLQHHVWHPFAKSSLGVTYVCCFYRTKYFPGPWWLKTSSRILFN